MSPKEIFIRRIKKIQKKLDAGKIYLFSDPSQINYSTGFKFLVNNEREAFFAVTKESATLIYTSFSPVSNYEFLNYLPGTFPSQLKMNLENIISNTKAKHILFDPDTLFVTELEHLKTIEDIVYNPMSNNFIKEIMINKDLEEIKLIRKACQISSQVFETIKPQIKIGMSELEISQLIEQTFEIHGVTELAFPTIVAFGNASSGPHHQPGNNRLEKDTVVLIDMGCKYQGYCSDMTRTFWFGNNSSEIFLKIEKIVKEAHQLAVNEAAKHSSAKNIDNAARVYISNQGFGEDFIHTTGHGLGLEIHESPSLSWQNNREVTPGMVFTIEPGIYLEGEFGYRYENTFLVTNDNIEQLTN